MFLTLTTFIFIQIKLRFNTEAATKPFNQF